MIDKSEYLNIQQNKNPFEQEDENEVLYTKTVSRANILKQNVETIIVSERKKEEQEQEKIMNQIIEIEDFIENNPQMVIYRKGIKKKIFLFSIFILVLIAERILYTSLLDEEETLIQDIQKGLDLNTISSEQNYAQFSDNYFWKIVNFGVGFHNSFLLSTQFIATVYVSVSDFVGIKLIFTTLLGLYFIGVLQMFYNGPLPFWTSDQISSPFCVQTSAHPSRFVFTVLYISYYFLFCLRFRVQRNKRKSESEKYALYKKIRIIQIVLGVLLVPFFFLVYLSGLQFIINVALGFIMFYFYYTVMCQSNLFISETLAKVSINTEQAKRNIFNWFIIFLVMIFAAYVVMLGTDTYVDINWIGNYLNCTQNNSNFFLNSQLVGPYHTFSVITVLGGLSGAIFGLNHTYNHLKQNCVKTWYKGTILKRFLRGLIINIFMIPSWVLNFYQNRLLKSDFVLNLGFNEFIIDILHYFLLYLLLFGFIPVYIYQPFNLVHIKKQKQKDRSITFLQQSMQD
ncbi:hypothetical protein ABPG74_018558 [Tetrahymena malaccensis]